MKHGWTTVALGDVCEINIGRTPSRSRSDYWGAGEPWLSIADMNQGRAIYSTKEQVTRLAVQEAVAKPVAPGTVLLSFKLSIGKVGIAQRRLFTNEAIAALPVRNGVPLEREYLAWALQHLDLAAESNRAAMGATLNKASLALVKLPLPPIGEQRRIAAILDKADLLENKRAQAIQLSESVLGTAFDRALVSEQARTELRDLTRLITKGTTPSSLGLPMASVGIPFLRAQNLVSGTVTHGGDGDLFVGPEVHRALRRSVIQGNDVLVSIAGTIGRSALVPVEVAEMNCNQAVALVRLREPNLGRWIQCWLETRDAQSQIGSSSVTGTISNLSLAQLGGLRVPAPDSHALARFNGWYAGYELSRAGLVNALATTRVLNESLRARAFSGTL